MKIGLNGQGLLNKQPAGPEVFTYNLYNSLSKIDEKNGYTIYFDKQPGDAFFNTLVNKNKKFSYVVVPQMFSWTQVGLATQLKKNPVDIFFTTIHTIPGLNALFQKSIKFVTMIHGLEYKKNKDLNKKFGKKLLHPFVLKFTTKQSDKLIVPSKATKNALIKNLKIEERKIQVIPEGVSKKFRKLPKIYKENYLLFVSTIQPRKNIPRMVEAFSSAKKRIDSLKSIELWAVGKKGWGYKESLEAPIKFGVEKSVKFLGRVEDDDMPQLFSDAKAFINVSVDEGFGLPVLEAMASEIPPLVSDIPAFRELAQNYALFCDPLDVGSIEEGIINILSKKTDTNTIKNAKRWSKKFTWENTAKKTLEIFKETVQTL